MNKKAEMNKSPYTFLADADSGGQCLRISITNFGIEDWYDLRAEEKLLET